MLQDHPHSLHYVLFFARRNKFHYNFAFYSTYDTIISVDSQTLHIYAGQRQISVHALFGYAAKFMI